MENEITITLTPEEAELFKLFQKHHDFISLLIERGVYNQRNARVSLNFDHEGTLQTIQREDFLFSKKFDKKH